jgi:MraZ protein
MSDETVNAVQCFNSLYQQRVDEKRRVQIPSKWRPADSSTELTVIYWPQNTAGACLRVLPPQQLDRLMKTLDAMSNDDPKKVPMKRFIGSNSEQVVVDKAGRICLPEKMARDAGLGKEVVLVGLLDRFEIWSPERYEKVSTADSLLAQDAFRLME